VVDDAGDGVVDAVVDGAVVVEVEVGDGAEPGLGFGLVEDDGLVGEVAAGHDEDCALAEDVEEEVVERG
jgi:hypothetical protein